MTTETNQSNKSMKLHPITSRLRVGIAYFALFAGLLLCGFAQTRITTGAKVNLLKNPSFEKGLEGWEFGSATKVGTAAPDLIVKRDGAMSIRIDNTTGDDSSILQKFPVKPATRYRFSGVIKTKGVVAKNRAATLSLMGSWDGSKSVSGSGNWEKVSVEFDSGGEPTITVAVRLGHWGSLAIGTAWFDDLAVEEIGPSARAKR